jgi:hypothetical protein
MLSPEQAMQHLREFAEQHSRTVRKATLKVCAVLAAMGVPAVWASLDVFWAALAGGLFGLCALLSYPLSRLDARKREQAWRSLAWKDGIAFLSPNRGLVYLDGRTWAFASTGRINHPGAVRGVAFDSESSSLMLSVTHGPHSWIEDIELPPGVPTAEAEALADAMTRTWRPS